MVVVDKASNERKKYLRVVSWAFGAEIKKSMILTVDGARKVAVTSPKCKKKITINNYCRRGHDVGLQSPVERKTNKAVLKLIRVRSGPLKLLKTMIVTIEERKKSKIIDEIKKKYLF